MRSIVKCNLMHTVLCICIVVFADFLFHVYIVNREISLGEFYALVLLRQVVTRPNVIKASLNKASCYQGKLLLGKFE